MATLDDLAEGQSREVEHDGRVYAIFNIGGKISAVDGICPHQGGPLADGPIAGNCVTCPWHGWQFDVTTGSTPINKKLKLPIFDVKIEGNEIFVAVP